MSSLRSTAAAQMRRGSLTQASLTDSKKRCSEAKITEQTPVDAARIAVYVCWAVQMDGAAAAPPFSTALRRAEGVRNAAIKVPHAEPLPDGLLLGLPLPDAAEEPLPDGLLLGVPLPDAPEEQGGGLEHRPLLLGVPLSEAVAETLPDGLLLGVPLPDAAEAARGAVRGEQNLRKERPKKERRRKDQ
jgi:hypothetical protein